MLTLCAAGWALTPVLLSNPTEEAMPRVALDSGTPSWELTPLVLPVALPEVTLLGAADAACAAQVPSLDALREATRAAENRLREGRFSVMRDVLGPQLRWLPCLQVPAEVSLVSRALFLYGYASFEMGDAATATTAWRRARDFYPELKWDDRIDPERGRLFREVLAEPVVLNFSLFVGPGLVPPLVDGRPVTVEEQRVRLRAGPHIVQTLSPARTWLVEAEPGGAAVLIHGAAFTAESLADPAIQPVLTALINLEQQGQSNALAWDGIQTWRLDGASWAALPASDTLEARARQRPAQVLLGAGIATTGVGAALVATELIQMRQMRTREPEGYGAVGIKDYEWRQRTADRYATGAWVAGGVTTLGLALGTVGWVIGGEF